MNVITWKLSHNLLSIVLSGELAVVLTIFARVSVVSNLLEPTSFRVG